MGSLRSTRAELSGRSGFNCHVDVSHTVLHGSGEASTDGIESREVLFEAIEDILSVTLHGCLAVAIGRRYSFAVVAHGIVGIGVAQHGGGMCVSYWVNWSAEADLATLVMRSSPLSS